MKESQSFTEEEMWLIRKIRNLRKEGKTGITRLFVECEQGEYRVSALTPKGKTRTKKVESVA
ncbi:MAG: hypothetical protein ACI9EW_002734 [Cellvibrionaceae bacterium]|jgi:hypothetical protein